MKIFFNYVTIFSAVLLIMVILLQNQGSSLGSGFGGETNFYRSKRGLEKGLFYLTIILAVIFIGSLITRLLITK